MKKYTPLVMGYLCLASPSSSNATRQEPILAENKCISGKKICDDLGTLIRRYDGTLKSGIKDGCFDAYEMVAVEVTPYLLPATTDAQKAGTSHYLSMITQELWSVFSDYDINLDGKICGKMSLMPDDVNGDDRITKEDLVLMVPTIKKQ